MLVPAPAVPAGDAEAGDQRRAHARAFGQAALVAEGASRLAPCRTIPARRRALARRMARTAGRHAGRGAKPHRLLYPWWRLLLLLTQDSPFARVRTGRALRCPDVLARLPARTRATVPRRARRCAGRVPPAAGRWHAGRFDRAGGRFRRRRPRAS